MTENFKYAKLDENGNIIFAPASIADGGKVTIGYNSPNNWEKLKADGYKRYYFDVKYPQDGKSYFLTREVTDEEIRLIYKEVVDNRTYGEKRAEVFASMMLDEMGAVYKALEALVEQGMTLPAETITMLEKIKEVKDAIPKE